MAIYLINLFSYIIILIVYKLILAKEFFTRRDFIYGVFYCGFPTLLYQYNLYNNTIEFIVGLGVIFIMIFTHLNYGILNAIITGFLTLFSNLLSNNIIEFLIKSMNIPTQTYNNNLLNYLLVTIAIGILSSIFSLIIYKIKNYIKNISDDLENKIILHYSAFLFSLMSTIFYWLAYHNNFDLTKNLKIFSIIQIIFVAIIFSFLIFMIRNSLVKQKLKIQEQKIKEQEIYIEEIEKIQKNLRIFKHDYKNVTLGILTYIENEDLAGLKAYCQEHIFQFEQQYANDDSRLDRIKNFQQKEIQSIVWTKAVQALSNKINLILEVEENIYYKTNILDLSRILGIWWDNAIEACKDNQKIRLLAYNDEQKTYLILENDCDKDFNLINLSDDNFSTKGENHGLGLRNIDEIIRNNDNLQNYTEIEDGVFRQILIVNN